MADGGTLPRPGGPEGDIGAVSGFDETPAAAFDGPPGCSDWPGCEG
jgi:hypothetical protein